jgi:hypothetical protein
VRHLQKTINFVEMFSSAASKHNISEISNILDSIYKEILREAKNVLLEHTQAILSSLLHPPTDEQLFDSDIFGWRFKQINYLRDVNQICFDTNQEFYDLQSKI